MINRYNSIIILLTVLIFLLVLSIFKINKVIHNTGYAQIENDSLKNVIITNNLENDKSVILQINDRGPFIKGRSLDLSYAAARELGFLKKGVQKIKYEVL